jgi:hypothetical protein
MAPLLLPCASFGYFSLLHGATQSVDTIADTLINNDTNTSTPHETGGGINHARVNSALIPYGLKAD